MLKIILVISFVNAILCLPNPDPSLFYDLELDNEVETYDNVMVSFEQFSRGATDNGYPAPNRDKYNNFAKLAQNKGSITSRMELAMFMAQVLWESMGLVHKKEIRCLQNNCAGEYRQGGEAPGKFYFGRGYIQLTWLSNYAACSQDLYGDNRLVLNPDLVSNTEEAAWGSAFWYWKTRVHNQHGIQQGQFGVATNAINGGLECAGAFKDKARKRFDIYVKVLKAFGLSNVKPNPAGCYPL